MTLFDEKGLTRAELSTGQDGPSLTLTDEHMKTRAALWFYNKYGPSLTLRDEKGNPSAELSADESGSSLALSKEKHAAPF